LCNTEWAGLPLDAVEVALSIMATDSIEQVVEHGDAHATAPLAHGRHHAPLVAVRVIALHTRYGIPATPPAH
jgi:hypothetical protein